MMRRLGMRSAAASAAILMLLLSQAPFLWAPSDGSPSLGAELPRSRYAPSQVWNLTLTMSVDLRAAKGGTEVTISGRVTFSNGTGAFAEVSIEVRNPYSSTIHLRFALTDSEGVFQDSFILPHGSPAGNYPTDVTACRGSICARRSSSFSVSPPDFTIDVVPKAVTLEQGRSITFKVTILPLWGFNSTVALSLQDSPNATSHSFSSSAILPPTWSELTIVTSPNAPVGTYTVLVVARGGGKEHSETISLTINAPSGSGWNSTLLALIVIGAAIVGVLGYVWRRRGTTPPAELRLGEDKDYLAVVRALTRLEELKALGKVESQDYERLREEYESKLEKLRKRRRSH